MDKTRKLRQRSANLEHDDARQPRFAMEVDVKSDKKTRKRTEDAAADQAMNADSSSTKMVQTGLTSSTIFGMKAEPPALPYWDDVLVNKGTAVPKPCLSLVKMHTLTATAGLLPAGKASTTTMIIYYQPRLWFCQTKEMSSGTSNQYVMDYSSFWKLKALKTKSGQTLVFDPGGSTGHQRACPFLGTWCAMLCGGFSLGRRIVPVDGAFLAEV